ncbi:hypothetical protein DVH24_022386 [Malus domestica]|uniref:X8 domain-containing protein n=1 Tax=Malus domestica TaxID=3750 RepID=A0A498KRC0_MALDO|nr:hypothetical protein DVH24_022386 [Malus domestica]
MSLPPSRGKKLWCLPRTEALQRNIDYVCFLGLDCGPIKQGGPCFVANTVRAHAKYAMNVYFQARIMFSYSKTPTNSLRRKGYACEFIQTGPTTAVDPVSVSGS